MDRRQWELERQKPSTTATSSFISKTFSKHGGRDEGSTTKGKGPLGLTTISHPSEPVVADLIFVHGLGGGSISTWTKDLDSNLFWPQKWLPAETGFKNVRIHTYGYNSNWSKESTLNIHDFAKSLLGSINDCPAIPRKSKTPLVFVAHSMGGLVIKKAYILASGSPDFESIAQRTQSMFFLATPHRGADIAQMFGKMLNVAGGPRPFVTDLHRNSLATQSINDEFPPLCQHLQLYSFYETVPTSFSPVNKSIIVEKDLAILGYHNERRAYLDADHRHVCKYSTPSDTNYQTVRNALASSIATLRAHMTSYKNDANVDDRRLLDECLDVSDAPEDELMSLESQRMKGSCEWLLLKESFRHWRDSPDAWTYWISAKPATGKSVLSGYIIKHFRETGIHCSFYFFNHGNKLKSTVESFLRAIAWQMAIAEPSVLQIVLEICGKDDAIRTATDYRTLWRKLFLEGILRVKFTRPQYWVVDALDECKDSEITLYLLKAAELCNIRVLVTSRHHFESPRAMASSKIKVLSENIQANDTKSDIALYLRENIDHIPYDNERAREEMLNQIIEKSAGCFLWVSLVLQELSRVYTSAGIRQILEDVPSDMNKVYSRILDSMSRDTHGKSLAKTILTWTVCSIRPLSIDELCHALQIDIGDTIDNVEKLIESTCGQLVYVDAQARVQLLHQTVRDFLLRSHHSSDSESLEFIIDKRVGHKRLAMTCLKYLNGSVMDGTRYRKLSVGSLSLERCSFVSYASASIFDHVSYIDTTDEELLEALVIFFSSSNILSWIEHLAQQSDLNRIIRSAKILSNFLQRRCERIPPIDRRIALLSSWSTDLVRLVTKFGKNLANSPSSIFRLIPPFCPSGSALRKQFATPRGISVLGLSDKTWDDCASTIVCPHDYPSALDCSAQYFAVGRKSGSISIYRELTCQEIQVLNHEESVKTLKFGETGALLASCGLRTIRVWAAGSWNLLYTFSVSTLCMSMAFTDQDRLLCGAFKSNHLILWDLRNGRSIEPINWTENLEGESARAFRRPIIAAFGMEQGLLAAVYRGQDVLLWDIEGDCMHGTYSKEHGATSHGSNITTSHAWCVAFNPATESNLLAAGFFDGDLVLFDTAEGTVKEIAYGANAHVLAASPDGRTLASGDSNGTIQLFDFETLRLLYRIRSQEFGIKSLSFSGDSHRLLDIRGSQCRVWDPTALVRQGINDDHSDSVSVSTAAQEVDLENVENQTLVTAIAYHESGEVFFCGKEDGSVYLYETRSGKLKHKLFSHADGVSIVSLFFDAQSQIIGSTDSSSRIMTHKIRRQNQSWAVDKPLFDQHVGAAIGQILCNFGYTRMLVCSSNADTLYSTGLSDHTIITALTRNDPGPYRWSAHPLMADQIILMTSTIARLYTWENLEQLTDTEGILLEGSILPYLSIRSIAPCFGGILIATTFSESVRSQDKSRLLLWDISDFSPTSKTAAPVPRYQYLSNQVTRVIGMCGTRLIFLHASGWVCSTDSETFSINRHFFIPADWVSSSSELLIDVSRSGDIIFVKRDEVAVIKKGLEASELSGSSSDSSRPRPSLRRMKWSSSESDAKIT